MIIAVLKIFPFDENFDDVLDVLLSVKGPVLAEPGCLTSCIYKELGEVPGLLYIEQWRSLPELERHIKSSSYARILAAMELSARTPETSFYETGETWHFELVERMRGSYS
jgi:quinol monooxygenase YgiN